MCLVLIAFRAHPRYGVVVAANRDEFHERPTAGAHWWNENVVAGKDLRAGGTWLGITRSGRFALTTNFRDGTRQNPLARSRGELVADALTWDGSLERYVQTVTGKAQFYNGFNLVVGSGKELHYFSNRDNAARALTPGVYALSNHLLDTPWPKLRLSKNRFSDWLASNNDSPDPLFQILYDTTPADEAHLPETGVGRAWEKLLSSPFIVSPDYGTRSSSVVFFSATHAWFIERGFNPQGECADEKQLEFTIEPPVRV